VAEEFRQPFGYEGFRPAGASMPPLGIVFAEVLFDVPRLFQGIGDTNDGDAPEISGRSPTPVHKVSIGCAGPEQVRQESLGAIFPRLLAVLARVEIQRGEQLGER
jgi:hypothetical protein